MGYAIAGTAVSSIAVMVGIGYMLLAAGYISALDSAVTAKIKEAEQENARQVASRDSVAGEMSNSTDSPEAGSPDNNFPAGPSWTPIGTPIRIGDVQVEITRVTVGKVPLKDTFGEETTSEDDLLTVWLRVSNLSERKKINHLSWMSEHVIGDPPAKLTDDADNRYRPINFGFTTRVRGVESAASIYPGKSIEDAVVFELPVEGIESLRLTLLARMFGEKDDIRFEIPSQMINKQ
ncbi:MAG: hypothetical protein WBC44_22330 [Planctomycetaceae bacterium]